MCSNTFKKKEEGYMSEKVCFFEVAVFQLLGKPQVEKVGCVFLGV